MDLGLRGRVAVVVGGANGIGLATARVFAAEGASVAILDFDESAAERAREIARASGVAAISCRCDITNKASLTEARSRVVEELGGVDAVVHAAAIGSGKFGFPFLNLSPSDWPRVMEVNVLGAVNVAHVFAPVLIEKGEGAFVMISSVAALIGSPTDPPYSASKAALGNFAQCMARDLASHGVRVNTVCPGMVKTDLNRGVWAAWNARQPESEKRSYEDWADEKVVSVVPLGRWQEPEDVARMNVFLCSDAARNVTGQTVNVDGGYVMR